MFSVKHFVFICFITVAYGAFGGTIGRTQSIAVKGALTCDGKPASGVLVKLFDDDRGLDSDDFLGSTKTDFKGEFIVSGHTAEITTIDPKINIYHDCNDGAKPCQRKFTIGIPDKYVSSGKTPTKTYNAGILELAGRFRNEQRDCIH
ncbi:unnamed protein product, partial [Mesorhabditis belari]|uniref:Transthyretin-like protein 5 n=1 Tax=Mesorhabditis belari TaxID=2138241 RepID=A0AAF3E935_9BILA